MKAQYKLFQLFNSEEKEKIKQEFLKDYIDISDKIIAIKYDMHKYNWLLEKMYKYNCKQYILTSSTFYQLIKNSFQNNFIFRDIDFLENITDELEELISLEIGKMRRNNEKGLEELLKILGIFKKSEGIDIENIELYIPLENRKSKVKIFNNGIVYSDTLAENKAFSLVRDSLEGKS